MKLTWARQQVGMWIAFDCTGRDVGYVFNRGPRCYSASAADRYDVCETLGQAKASVRRAIETGRPE